MRSRGRRFERPRISVSMAKIWVLDTETKGTGAEMVPLDKVLRKPAPRGEPLYVPEKPRPRPATPPQPPPPRIFKVVDVMTREVLAEGADTRTTVDLLEEVRSIVDVRISVWQPKTGRWRPLTLGEQRAMWEFRGRRATAPRVTPR
jgi:hypothetical protein